MLHRGSFESTFLILIILTSSSFLFDGWTLVGYANIKLAVPRSFPIDMASVLMNVSFVNIDIA